MNNELENLIPAYALNKSELDSYKKLCDDENSRIKELMFQLELNEAEAGGYIAKRIVQKRENINEDKLLEIAHKYNLTDIIKTKEYIDYDVLENALYNNMVPPDAVSAMNNAKTIKEIVTLRVTAVKEKKVKK